MNTASIPRLHFADTGPVAGGPTLVLLHGVGGGHQVWDSCRKAAFHAGFRAIAFDLPMYGASAAIEPYTLAGAAQAVARTLASIGITEAVWLGHSMGGMVAQEAAAHTPQSVQGLILAGTSPAFGKPGGDWQAQFLAARFAPLDAGKSMPALAQELVPSMVALDCAFAVRESAITVMSGVTEATYRCALTALSQFDRRANLAAITVPTLCIAGEFDRNAAPDIVQKMAARIPQAQYALMHGIGHLMNMEDEAGFNRLVVDFLVQHFR
jgi:3-oxoadipate enol-lactonase